MQGKIILAWLQQQYPEVYPDSLLRMVHRRLAAWPVRHGQNPAVIFPQAEEPGRIGYCDFTHASELAVTLEGQPFRHLLYQFRLGYSGWHHVDVVVGGESFAALGSGLRTAITDLGGVPRIHRTDSRSAAFRNLDRRAAEDQTRAYRQLCIDLGMQPTRNNPGVSHENGAIESLHGHLKSALDQALRLRGSRDFVDVLGDRAWITGQVAIRQAAVDPARMAAERAALRPLPAVLPSAAAVARTVDIRVSTSSTICVGKIVYSVPERLIGQQLRVLVYQDRLECFWHGEKVEVLLRQPCVRDQRARSINYHHVIESLLRKPGAFPRLVYRDQIHPSPVWKATWEALCTEQDERVAARTYLGLLMLAHRAGCEAELGGVLTDLRAQGLLPELEQLRQRFLPPQAADLPPILIMIPDAGLYDQLLQRVWSYDPTPTRKEA